MAQSSQSGSAGRSLGQTVVAVLVLAVVGYILLKVIIGIALAIAAPVVSDSRSIGPDMGVAGSLLSDGALPSALPADEACAPSGSRVWPT